jgi:uncharacterized Tic20 family protein
MSEEKKELKLVDVSFKASLKFWLAYLIVQIIAMIIVFGVMLAFIAWASQMLKDIIPEITPQILALAKFL